MSARDDAWRATQIAYAKLLTNMTPPGQSPHTDFDVASVIASAPIPKTSSLAEHQHCWDALKRRFDEAWGRAA